ncbi:hypothetical protein BC938DRAFT_475653 [Jimgerdemannia flammicorona]|uniref:Uncharacterized protein n=1 Tax=Jimgerdemannia flammicorona TaxID=994334 RepID=A0A433PQU0_9FUNG|nr:hypothetical protein BC938DRAFT_475653 [Jimgerdemannia flammicorona]
MKAKKKILREGGHRYPAPREPTSTSASPKVSKAGCSPIAMLRILVGLVGCTFRTQAQAQAQPQPQTQPQLPQILSCKTGAHPRDPCLTTLGREYGRRSLVFSTHPPLFSPSFPSPSHPRQNTGHRRGRLRRPTTTTSIRSSPTSRTWATGNSRSRIGWRIN